MVAGELPGTSSTSPNAHVPVLHADDTSSVDDHLQEPQASSLAAASPAQSAQSVTSGKQCLVVCFLIMSD